MKNTKETTYIAPRDLKINFIFDNSLKDEPQKIELSADGKPVSNCVMMNLNADGRRGFYNTIKADFLFEYHGRYEAKGVTVMPFDEYWKNKIFFSLVKFVNTFIYDNPVNVRLRGKE